jgi:hypothetical protein
MSDRYSVSAQRVEGGWTFECLQAHFFRFLYPVSIDPGELRSQSEASESIRILRSLIDEPGVVTRSDSLFVPDDIIARWDAPSSDLEKVGLPSLCPFRLSISSDRPIADPTGKISLTWMGANAGLKIPAVTRDGTLIRTADRRFLVRDPLRSLLDAIEKTNAASTIDDRMRCFAVVRQHLLNVTDGIQAPDNLKNMVIYQATALGIETQHGSDGYTFRPELLGDIPSDEEDVAPTRTALLNRFESLRFRDRLTEAHKKVLKEARPSYVLSSNTYVVLDPGVQAALKVVLDISRSDAETRRAFFEDKMSFLLPELEKVGSDGSIIEFSDRVIGIRPWEGSGGLGGGDRENNWFPDQEATTFTIRDADGKSIVLSGEALDKTVKAIRAAHERGEKEVTVDGQNIAIDERVIEDLERIAILQKPSDPSKPKEGAAQPPRYFFVKPKDNVKDLTYVQPLGETRAAELAVQLGLRNEPQEHQRQGIAWFQQAYLSGMRGLLMADDMGLGKTFQVLAFLKWLKLTRGERKPVLVVAPKTLLGNWLEEVEIHLGEDGLGKPLKLYDKHLKEVRKERGRDITLARETLDLDTIRSADWVLTTYETLRDYQISFAQVRFEVIVFDEAQKVKESGAMVTEAARAQNAAALRIMMTGTPVENSLMDLWTLFDVAWPGRLGYSGQSFRKEFVKTKDADLGSIRKLLSEPSKENGILIPPLMLRRMKEDVANLPKKHMEPRRKDMPKEQADAYSQIVQAKKAGRLNALAALQAIRNVSLHPDLQAKIDYSDPRSIDAFIRQSARMTILFDILDEIKKNNEKALVFIDLRRAQSILAELIKARYRLDYLPYVINGETPTEKRDAIRKGFQKRRGSFEALLLAPKAAGFGLTLHAANHVIHLNRWWNPAVEDQCTDRAYRIGQNSEVTVWLPIAAHPDPAEIGGESYDLVLDEMLFRKRKTSRDVITPVQFDAEEMAILHGRIFGGDAHVNDLAGMDWKRFEELVIERLIDAGFETSRTPRTGDGGADAVAKLNTDRTKGAIIQVKHRSKGKLGIVLEQEVLQVLQAKDRYDIKNPRPVLVTNGSVEPKGHEAAKWHGITIVDYSNIDRVGTVVRAAC